jgi:hypothetical protein
MLSYSGAIYWEAEELGEVAVTETAKTNRVDITNTLQECTRNFFRDMLSGNKQ